MTAKHLMIFGAAFGVMFSIAEAIIGSSELPSFGVIMFACGALFGKGYGIWEDRERRSRKGDGNG